MIHWYQFLSVVFVLTACDSKKEILTASYSDNYESTDCVFRLFSDSSYTLHVHEEQGRPRAKEQTFQGRCVSKGDSVVSVGTDFGFEGAKSFMIKNNYLEFFGGKEPFKMKITKRENWQYAGIDTTTYHQYGLFTFDKRFYRFESATTPYDLTNDDLRKVETILAACIKESKLGHPLTDYFKQCVAFRNEIGERLVWINLHCNRKGFEHLRYFVVTVHDGGDCYFNVILNLDKNTYFDLIVNGNS